MRCPSQNVRGDGQQCTGQRDAATMSAEQMTSLVQRKARTGRDAQAARAMSLARALRVTAAKQADQMMGLAVSALSVTRRSLGAEDIGECFQKDWLVLLMDGENGQVAAAMLDPVLVAGLIQQQTMGKVRPVPEGEAVRNHTATDAALCSPFIETLLIRAAPLPDIEIERELLQGYRFGVWAEEIRQAQLALDSPTYEIVEMTLDLAAGARAGKLVLILPERAPVQSTHEEDVEGEPIPPEQSVNLMQNSMGLTAELTIALTRLKLPIQQVSALKVGDVLDLNLSSMAKTLVLDANGRAICLGTLGQVDGVRAVQVEHKKGRQRQPQRRAEDREELNLPDVSATEVVVPNISDVDIFGDINDLPAMPDIDEASKAADDQMSDWDMSA
jgi:flagellar motor switch protein FliM